MVHQLNTAKVKSIEPYGGRLIRLLTQGEERQELIEQANRLHSVQISARSLCDLELLATGAFSPLDRFMGKADYERVIHEMRLANGDLFPIPITLTVPEELIKTTGEQITLRDARNNLLAIMQVEEVFHWDLDGEAALVLGTRDPRHPLVSEMSQWGDICVSGSLQVIFRNGSQRLSITALPQMESEPGSFQEVPAPLLFSIVPARSFLLPRHLPNSSLRQGWSAGAL